MMNSLYVSLIVICRICVITGLYVLQRIGSTQEGNTSFTLSGDYYNRELSGNKIHVDVEWEVSVSLNDTNVSKRRDKKQLTDIY